MAEQILLGFFCCSLVSVVLLAWTSQPNVILNSILCIILECLSILKIFGIALLAIIALGIGILLWEQVLSQTHLWTKLSPSSENQDSPDSQHEHEHRRSILPILILIIIGLAILPLLINTSSPTTTVYSSPKTEHPAGYLKKPIINQTNKAVIQFFAAILTLAVVIGFILFNRDEYRAWKARHQLSKLHRRRAKQHHSLVINNIQPGYHNS